MKKHIGMKLNIIFTASVLVMSIFAMMCLNGSVAWFANNNDVTARGMSLGVNTSPNLIIGMSEAEIMEEPIRFSVTFPDEQKGVNMVAVTHDETVADTYLKYMISHHAVDHFTGNVEEGANLEFAPVPADQSSVYFIDYIVYVASAYKPLPVKSLEASITLLNEVDDIPPYFNAMSIDFYVDEVSSAGYRGTTSVAGGLTGERVVLMEEGTVPLNTEDTEKNYITVIMRCYFDGALQDTETKYAYINSETVGTTGVAVSVSITAVDVDTETEE